MDVRSKGILIDSAINQYHWKQNIPVMPEDLQDIYDSYVADYENDRVYSVQQSFKFTIDNSLYVGRADQIRHGNKGLAVWDIKYSALQGKVLVDNYIESLMIYAYGLKVRIGGIINVRNYSNLLPVFHIIDAPCPKSSEMRILNNLIHEENYKRK